MSSDVVLSAALRNNLLSLQSTQTLIDQTQLRLATGLKVNSALDNPQSFFTAQSLNNRASDLQRLLDGISQSIRTIETADDGVTALTTLVEQADSIVNQARDEISASEGVARAIGDVDLSSSTNLVATLGITTGDNFNIEVVNDAGTLVTENVQIVTNDTVGTLAARITNQFADNQDGEITASVTDDGFLSIQSSDGRSFRIRDENVGAGDEITDAGFTALGLGDYFEVETQGANTRAAATIVAGNELRSISLYESGGNLLEAGDTIVGTTAEDADGNTVISGFAANDDFTFSIYTDSGTTTVNVTDITATTSFQDLVDAVNGNAAASELIEAEFDSLTGQIVFTKLSDDVNSFGITANAAGASNFSLGLGDSTGNLVPVAIGAATAEERIYSLNSSTETLDSLASDYNTLRSQIDDLVEDANYRGINLLNGDDLVTFFNESRSNSLTTSGTTFTADGLGITEAQFRNSDEIENSASQVLTALDSVRSFGSSLANSLSIIEARQNFTQETINTLKAGAEDLTVADQNEEGANLLALQTRQQLGITSLSLAAQSQQSVLRLF